MKSVAEIERSYDVVADVYAQRFFDELAHKPFDRVILDWLIARVGTHGQIGDIGCGPGQIAAYLHARGASTRGVDLAHEMVRVAHALTPGVLFERGDMRALPLPDAALGGLAAFYSIIHIAPDELPLVFREFYRVLKPGGTALLSCHIGDEAVHIDNFLGLDATFDGYYYQRTAIRALLETAGFTIDEAIERDPYPDIEFQSRRLYVFAHR